MRPSEGHARPRGPEGVEYTVRVSARARHVRLLMKPQGLEVVIPQGFSQRRIPGLLEGKRAWIERASREVQARKQRLAEDPPCLPDKIDLPAVGEEWRVEYRSPGGEAGGRPGIASRGREGASGIQARESAGCRLVVHGDGSEFEGCKAALGRWLGRRARAELPRRLDELAREHGFDYEKVSIRQQRTRWGSCSRRGSISLNARLLLLPAEACDYVLLHELCHTKHLDHSTRFWALLERCDPDYRAHKKLVRTASKSLPTWLDHEQDEAQM